MSVLTEEQRAQMPSIVAYCPKCGNLIGASVQSSDYLKESSKFASDCVKRGLRVATISVADVRVGKWCDCPRGRNKK